MQRELDKLLQANPSLWRGRDGTRASKTALATGFAELDAALPGGGWPRGALVEILAPRWGIGELRLLLPVMASLSHCHLWLVWIAPPWMPYAPALAAHRIELSRNLVLGPETNDIPWSMEQVLRAEACGMALAWPGGLTDALIRRLQLAAEAGNSLGFLFRAAHISPSPAALRLHLEVVEKQLQVRILKARGGWGRRTIYLTP